ncbi:hypothetical protein NP142_13975 [Salmonella enterica]|uniref:hypothetical protein n=1 Tax=Salmonella TaxID=590 RepID=UPI000B619F28|nr:MULTISPECIES: hypothetical protein [Salmonella]ASN57583.1 hypothetical protein CGL53_18785 [Salmonella enterica subsp. enterica serovar Indiana]EEJ2275906.1 hypothetical protein [Salmonella enterica subsp. enterica]MBJ5712888.1 hypothetical protein [Salmonella enterica subsp. enterica serovar Indiana]MBJ6087428.1 hypothetical protein [Salmonella enterica subsp. enterica serovar Indiana]MBM8358821.1 hypothetical protein [Salmonella enterica]
MTLITELKKFIDRCKYRIWIRRFSARIFDSTGSKEAVRAELECWPFEPDDNLYNWRETDPFDAADDALSYYGE